MSRGIVLGTIIVAAVALGTAGYFYYGGYLQRSAAPVGHRHVVAVVNPGGAAYSDFFGGFEKRLKEIHHEKGESVDIVYRDAEGNADKLKELITEAVKLKPDLIVTISSPPTAQALEETKESRIPILTALGDPVEHGYVKSLKSSGTNLAGVAQQNIELTPKRFEILKELVPSVKKVAVFYDTTCGPTKKARPIANAAAPNLGLTLVEFPLTKPSRADLETALKGITRDEFDALMFYPHGTLFSKADLFLKTAREEKLPIVMPDTTSLKDGALASYGPSYYEMGELLARQAEKILTFGVRPEEIPFEQPVRIEFVVSLKNAEILGIKVPEAALEKADRAVK